MTKCLRCGYLLNFERYKLVGVCTNHKCIDSKRTYDAEDYLRRKKAKKAKK